MSLNDYHGKLYAFRLLQQRVKDDIDQGVGDIKPVKVIYREADRSKTALRKHTALRFVGNYSEVNQG